MSGYAWTDRAVREALGLSLDRADDGVEFAGVSTDSRSVEEGDLFVAITGEQTITEVQQIETHTTTLPARDRAEYKRRHDELSRHEGLRDARSDPDGT